MRKSKKSVIVFMLAIGVIALFLLFRLRNPDSDKEIIKEVKPFIGSIQNTISTTGTVLPKNRLEVKPPVNGRVEEILVHEGEMVRVGETLAWMSSMERAALLDAARGEGEEALQRRREVYKAIPLISPIDGEVIVAKTQPGQQVTTSDPVIVISDKLIVRAQVDETDIGKVSVGQAVIMNLHAYPDDKINATVDHIYYESKTVNNVTIYEVDVLPAEVPAFFRSGMNATINIIENSKEDVLLIPLEAVSRERGDAYILLAGPNRQKPIKKKVTLAISDGQNVEVLSGVDNKDTLIVKTKRYTLPKGETGTNPFMPNRQRRENR